MNVETGAEPVVMGGVREHAEGFTVELAAEKVGGRLVVKAANEGGFNHTEVDLLDLLAWLHENRPDLLGE